MTGNAPSFDFIIAGGGSAGCVLADLLSRDGQYSVLLVEEGRRDRNPWLHIPGTFFKAWGTRDMAAVSSENDATLDGRPHVVPIGTVVGGGSSVNGLIYMRGQAQDYDDWADMYGCKNWRYEDVLPVFVAQENNDTYGEPYHGKSGPLHVSSPGYRHELSLASIDAANALGIPRNDDFNGAHQEGAGFYQMTMHRGRRMSSAVAFLRPALKRANFTLMTDTKVLGVEIKNRRAVGIKLRTPDGVRTIAAKREVILSAGAFGSAKLLMLSGVGPASHLQNIGVDVHHDSPQVGASFQDHVGAPVFARLKKPIGLYGADKGFKAVGAGLEYILTRRGLLASNMFEAGACVDTQSSGRPDVQINFSPFATSSAGQPPVDFHAVQVNPMTMRPKGRGRMFITSADPDAGIKLSTSMLGEEADLDTLRRGVRLAREIMSRSPLKEYFSEEVWPGKDISSAVGSNNLDLAIARHARTIYHPSGTCGMGGASESVVDPYLRVNGISGLRVADCSVMPALVSGNTNAPTMMIAARAAGFILEEKNHDNLAEL